jgi:hypothetical protein
MFNLDEGERMPAMSVTGAIERIDFVDRMVHYGRITGQAACGSIARVVVQRAGSRLELRVGEGRHSGGCPNGRRSRI